LHAALGHVEALAAAQLEVSVADMYIAVADAAVLELEQHLGARRPGGLAGGRLQGFAPFRDVVAEHGVSDECRCRALWRPVASVEPISISRASSTECCPLVRAAVILQGSDATGSDRRQAVPRCRARRLGRAR